MFSFLSSASGTRSGIVGTRETAMWVRGIKANQSKVPPFLSARTADVSEGLSTPPRDKGRDGDDGLKSQGGEKEGGREVGQRRRRDKE